jgi:hypothetical protein
MIKVTLNSILKTTRVLISDRGALAIFAGLYALFLAALYGFIATREATVWQVLLTLLFVATAPAIFFLLQAAIINRARAGRIEWPRVLRDSTKLALLTLPVILIGLGIMWLLNRWQAHFPAPHVNSAPLLSTPAVPPLHWPTVLFATLRALIFGVALPLTLIQLWVELAGQNLVAFVRGGRAFLTRLGQILARAFAPRSVLIYGLGLIIFALLPYVLLFVHIPLKGAWSEMSIFTVRLVLVFLFILLGWLITLGTFARSNEGLAVASAEPPAEESA